MTDATGTRTTYLATAEVAVRLLHDPAVAAAWERPTALATLSVSGLAGHLARQVHRVSEVVAAPRRRTRRSHCSITTAGHPAGGTHGPL